MSVFHEVSPKDLTLSPFHTIGTEWMLIAAEREGRVNAMTASWGGLGVIWNKNVAYIFIRDSRFTKEFVDAADTFSLTVFDHEAHKEMLTYMGRISGRDEDKIEKTGLTVCHHGDTPYFEEAKLVLICKKLCRQPITPDHFIADDIDARCYPTKDYHDMYIGEITAILEK